MLRKKSEPLSGNRSHALPDTGRTHQPLIDEPIKINLINPFAPGDFAEKHVLKLVEWFSGHCRAVKS